MSATFGRQRFLDGYQIIKQNQYLIRRGNGDYCYIFEPYQFAGTAKQAEKKLFQMIKHLDFDSDSMCEVFRNMCVSYLIKKSIKWWIKDLEKR